MESTVRRPLPTSTSVPTIVLTIWWQKADAETSNSNRAIPESPGSSHRQDAPVTRRTRVGIVPSGRSVGRRQNEVKSCMPTRSPAARFMVAVSNGASTCQVVVERNGSGSARFRTR